MLKKRKPSPAKQDFPHCEKCNRSRCTCFEETTAGAFTVICGGRDCHDVPIFFAVVDNHGRQLGIFPSEREAIEVARFEAAWADAAAYRRAEAEAARAAEGALQAAE